MKIEIGWRLQSVLETFAIAVFNPFSLFIIAIIIINILIWSNI